MASLTNMVKRLQGLQGTRDLNSWEEGFVASIQRQTKNGDDTTVLSDEQIKKVEQIFRKHFAD